MTSSILTYVSVGNTLYLQVDHYFTHSSLLYFKPSLNLVASHQYITHKTYFSRIFCVKFSDIMSENICNSLAAIQ